MWPFKKKQESPEEKAALERLDEATREVSAGELHKELPGMLATLGPFEDQPASGSEGLREALREGEEEREQKSSDGEPS